MRWRSARCKRRRYGEASSSQSLAAAETRRFLPRRVLFFPADLSIGRGILPHQPFRLEVRPERGRYFPIENCSVGLDLIHTLAAGDDRDHDRMHEREFERCLDKPDVMA